MTQAWYAFWNWVLFKKWRSGNHYIKLNRFTGDLERTPVHPMARLPIPIPEELQDLIKQLAAVSGISVEDARQAVIDVLNMEEGP